MIGVLAIHCGGNVKKMQMWGPHVYICTDFGQPIERLWAAMAALPIWIVSAAEIRTIDNRDSIEISVGVYYSVQRNQNSSDIIHVQSQTTRALSAEPHFWLEQESK